MKEDREEERWEREKIRRCEKKGGTGASTTNAWTNDTNYPPSSQPLVQPVGCT